MFSDASEKAYGAAIYAVFRCDDTKCYHLIASKTRVAPVKSLSLPRLELCAAVLGVNLLETVHRVLVILFDDRLSLNGWTDSTIVLSWLSKPASSWQTFIRNRISKIQSFSSFEKWNHLSVKKTQLIFALVESLQTKLQTCHCGGADHLGYPKNRHGHILQLLQLVFSQFKQTSLLFRLVKPATFNQILLFTILTDSPALEKWFEFFVTF